MDRNRWKAQCQILICAAVLDAAILGLMAGTVQVRAGAADSRKELSLAEEQAILPDTGRILPAGSPEMTAEEGKENSRFAALGSVVALTFDDGPDVYTSTLLDTLEQYGAQATFFMLGSNVEKYGADVIPRMAAIGCELGNHSYAHPNMKELSTDDGLAQFQMTDDLIAQYNNGQGATVIRFPYGNSTDELLASIGRPSIMWDVDTLDWQTKNVQANISAVLNSVSPGDIILMHDIHAPTVKTVEKIIPWLIENGYDVLTVSELMERKGIKMKDGKVYASGK